MVIALKAMRPLNLNVVVWHAKYSGCAQVGVRTLSGKQGYLVSMIIYTSTLAHNLNEQNK